jgi:hypothetical protein
MAELRVLRSVPDPLGSYLRPSGRDHKVLLQMLVEGKSVGTGLVADPCLADRQRDMLDEARRQGVETVLDPRTVDLSTVGGFMRSGVTDLPWACAQIHSPADLTGPGGVLAVRQLVAVVEAGGHSAVLAPTHYLDGTTDPWRAVDAELTRELRRTLDRRGLEHVLIYYPLVGRATFLRDAERRDQLIAGLAGLPIDALWLRLHPFGTTTSGPLALKRYLEMCRALHVLGVPLVADHSGTVGVALLAFGAVGGIESGITIGEGVNLDGYLKSPKPSDKPFAPQPRVYLHEIGAFLDPKKAEGFFAFRGMKTAHGCQNSDCCQRGWRDMQLEPRRHFIAQRAREVAALSAVPETLRAGYYLENFLRPASDRAMRAVEADATLTPARKRLDSWRGTLGADMASRSSFTMSVPAAGKRLRRSA